MLLLPFNPNYELQATITEFPMPFSTYEGSYFEHPSFGNLALSAAELEAPGSIHLWFPRGWASSDHSWKSLGSQKSADREIAGHPDCSNADFVSCMRKNITLCVSSQAPIPVQLRLNSQVGRRGAHAHGRSQSSGRGQ